VESLTVDIDGPVHYADYGGSGPPLLLIHGLAGSYLNWMSVADRLAITHRVWALDLRGFGLTPLALRLSAHRNGVSELHGGVARDQLRAELRTAEAEMAAPDSATATDAIRRYGTLEERFTALGGYAAESHAARICATMRWISVRLPAAASLLDCRKRAHLI